MLRNGFPEGCQTSLDPFREWLIDPERSGPRLRAEALRQ